MITILGVLIILQVTMIVHLYRSVLNKKTNVQSVPESNVGEQL
jgi:hypothetical protein